MNRAVVGDYFQDVAKYTEGLQPISIWNMDESGFHFEHQPIKVVCKKGVRAVNSRVSSEWLIQKINFSRMVGSGVNGYINSNITNTLF